MRTPVDLDFKDKTALIRCDFNISFDENGNTPDDFRVRESIPTIRAVIDGGGKAVLMSHAGEGRSLKGLIPLLEELLKRKVKFVSTLGREAEIAVNKADFGDIILLENLRFFKGEKENSDRFAGELALLGDIYINEAFSVCHRKHASVVRLTEILPHCAGFKLAQEVKVLSRVRDNPWHPMVTIIGGAKVASKIRVVEAFLAKSDHVLLGGKVANEMLVIKGLTLNRPWPDEEVIKEVEKIELTSSKIHLPVDLIVSPPDCEHCFRADAPGRVKREEEIYDIGPETIKIFTKIISEAKMMVWAGPLGLFEDRRYEKGTREIARAMAMNHRAFKVIGGGDTGIAMKKFRVSESIDHISTGGGAMLEFMAGNELPGLKALGYYDEDKKHRESGR